MKRQLHVWIPSNRTYDSGKPKAMDGLNEMIDDNRTDRQMGARVEKDNVEWCTFFIRRAMHSQHWRPMDDKRHAKPCEVILEFVEVNRRRDVSNIVGGGMKYVLDALSRTRYDKRGKVTKLGAAAIYDDSVRWLTDCTTRIRVDPLKPGINVTVITEDE